jgi:uncharacterized protein (DUF2267 family)
MMMSATGLEVFDKTLQTTNIWLQDIMKELGPDRRVAWRVLGAVLRALRDRLPVELAVHLGAQLPLLVRGTYYEQWHLRHEPKPMRDVDEFLQEISDDLSDLRPINSETAARSVFKVLSHHVGRGQVENVRNALPAEIRKLWPEGFYHKE